MYHMNQRELTNLCILDGYVLCWYEVGFDMFPSGAGLVYTLDAKLVIAVSAVILAPSGITNWRHLAIS